MKSGRSKNDPLKAGYTMDDQGSRSKKKLSSKRAEKNGRRLSDTLFANIIEKMNEGFVALDAQMNYTYVNERGGELLNRDPMELIGKNYWEEYPQDKYTAFGRAYRLALETQTPIELEEYYTSRDRWFENRIYPSADGLSIFFDDITERKRAEHALRESEDRFQTLANGSTVLLWVNGLEGCEFVNREYLDFLGVERTTDIRGYDWSGFVHPDDREAYMDSYLRAFNAQRPFRDEFRFRRRDGLYRWMRSEARPRRAEDGTFLGFVGASVDITERRQAEEALREKDKQLHRVTDVTPTLFSQCSRELRYLFVNRAAAEFLGAPAEEIIGRPIRELIGDDGFHAILPYIERVLKGERVEYEMEIPYRVMGPRYMHVVYIPEEDDKGNVTGWIATVTDITERKQVENERSQLLASERAQRANVEFAQAEAEQAKAAAERELSERKLAEEALGLWADSPLPQEARPGWLHYGAALAATAFVILLRIILDPLLGSSVQYSLLLGAIAFSVWYGGIGPALLALGVGYLSIAGFILDWQPFLAPTATSLSSLVIFLFISVIIVAIGWSGNRAQRHAHQSARVSMERKRQVESRLQEQQRVEAALRESERKFSLIYNRLPFAAALSSPTDGVILDVNQEFENVFGYTRHEAIGKTSLELGINPDQGQRTRILAELLLTGSAHNLELTLVTRNQGERIFLLNLDLVVIEGEKYILQTAQDITERKRAELALRQSEARLVLLSGISELIRKSEDPNELLYDVSKALGEHLGVRRCLFNETDVENDLEIVHRDYYDGVESVEGVHKVSDYSSVTTAEMQAGKTVVNVDSKVDERTASDYERTYGPNRERAYIAVPMLRENRWVATLWVSDDTPRLWSPEEVSLLETIAERTWATIEKLRIDTALRASEARLRLATQAAQMFTWELDIQTQVSHVADNFAEALGFSSDLIPKENSEILQRFIHPDDGQVILQALGDAIQKHHDLRDVQYRIVHPETGEPIWLEVNGKLVFDAAGNPSQMYGVAQNITDRKQVEDDLKRFGERERVRAAQLEAIMEAVPAVIWIAHDPEARLVTGNRASYEVLRLPATGNASLSAPDVAQAAKFEVLYNGQIVGVDELPVQRAARGDEVFGFEEEVRFDDGTSVFLLGNAVTLRDADNNPAGALAAFVDITARKRAEGDLRQLNLELESRVQRRTAQLKSANQALEESQKRLQTLSHRLVEVQEEERRAIARELHDRVGQSLSALNLNLTIINNQLSTMMNDQINKRLVDSIHLVAEVIAQVRDVMANLRPTVLDDFGLEATLQMYVKEFTARYLIDTEFEKNFTPLPRLGSSIEMTLLRIVQECLLNVARHAQAERVALALQMEENTVRLIVQDDGVGIQSWQLANRPGGHGLMIMRERAEAVGGNFRITSTPGKGTQIEVLIPVQTRLLMGNSS